MLEWGKLHKAKPSEVCHFQYNKSGILNLSQVFLLLYPCYSMSQDSIPYSLNFVGVSMHVIRHYVQIALLKQVILISATLCDTNSFKFKFTRLPAEDEF